MVIGQHYLASAIRQPVRQPGHKLCACALILASEEGRARARGYVSASARSSDEQAGVRTWRTHISSNTSSSVIPVRRECELPGGLRRGQPELALCLRAPVRRGRDASRAGGAGRSLISAVLESLTWWVELCQARAGGTRRARVVCPPALVVSGRSVGKKCGLPAGDTTSPSIQVHPQPGLGRETVQMLLSVF